MRITAAQTQAIVIAAVKSGRIPPSRRDYWAGRIKAGGRAGGQALAELAALYPVPPDPRRQGAAALPEGDDLYALIYPEEDPERGCAALEAYRCGRDQAADRWARSHTPPPGGEMRAAAPGAAAYTDEQLYRALFGGG